MVGMESVLKKRHSSRPDVGMLRDGLADDSTRARALLWWSALRVNRWNCMYVRDVLFLLFC